MGAPEEIGQYLVDQSVASGLGIDIFPAFAPPDVDNMIAVLPTGGVAPDRTMGSALGSPNATYRPSFQVLVRNLDVRLARDKAQAVWDKLENVGERTLQGTNETGTTQAKYLLIQCDQSEPTHIGADENGRHQYGVNISVHKEKSQVV